MRGSALRLAVVFIGLLPRLIAAQDTPDQAPSRPEARSLAAAAAGETQTTFEAPVLKLRVSDGFDLDRYMFRYDGPLDFTLDLKGFEVRQSVELTLRAWDVDLAGSGGCGPEIDRVLVNGTEVGSLRGADSDWSDSPLTIPAGILQPGKNQFQVDIDSAGTGCWAVQVDWAEIEIPFNIAQVETRVEQDVDLQQDSEATGGVVTLGNQEGNLIQDPIWLTQFDPNGETVKPPTRDYPIATVVNSTFGYHFQIDAWPEPPEWKPHIKSSWEILRTENGVETGTEKRSEEEKKSEDWEDDLSIESPSKVGHYLLRVTFDIYHETEKLTTEQRTHDLYVVWTDPRHVLQGAVPLTHLKLATEWAAHQGSIADIFIALARKEHENPLGWNYGYSSPGVTASIDELIGNGRGRYGDCHRFAEVWQKLGQSLGVPAGRYRWEPKLAFLTPENPKALDGNAAANALNLATGQFDRWAFDNHEIGTSLLSDRGYDPTFGYIGSTMPSALRAAYVYCSVDVDEGKLPADKELQCKLEASPSESVPLVSSGERSPSGWIMVQYGVKPIAPHAPAPATSSPPAVFGNAPSERGEDADANGLFEHLRVDAEVQVAQAGSFGVEALLLSANGRLIDLGSLSSSPLTQAPLTTRTLPPGSHTLTLYFGGRKIRDAGEDGPYTIVLRLVAEDGSRLDQRILTSRNHDHRAFQGLLAEVNGVTDAGIDTNTLRGFDVLRVGVDLDVSAAGDITVDGTLFVGELLLGKSVRTLRLDAGRRRVDLDFPGIPIAVSRRDGPYRVALEVRDALYTAEPVRRDTSAYRFTDFQPPAAFFDGSARDAGRDADADGAFDALDLTVRIGALAPGRFTLRGALEAADGSLLGTTESTVAAPAEATLSFGGLPIGRHGTAGPYVVHLSLIDGSRALLATLDHRTAAYSAAAFEQPEAKLGSPLSDQGEDTDGDGLLDSLRVGIPVSVSVAGTYEIQAALVDASGELIASAQDQATLGTGPRSLNLSFPGPAIRGHRVDGPYRVVSLILRLAGGRTLDLRPDAHTTSAYGWSRFQSSGPELTGVSSDEGVDLDTDSLFDRLDVSLELAVVRSGYYSFNARLMAGDQEIGWASGRQFLQEGLSRIPLAFDGRLIYGHGIDGPYTVENLSVASGDGSQTLHARRAATTGMYPFGAFERSGVLTGRVSVGGEPLAGATLYVSGAASQRTGADGTYRLPVLRGGSYTVRLQADPELAPWEITVDGQPAAPGTSATVFLGIGQTVRIDFESAVSCDEIYPIALHRSTLAGATPGMELKDVLNGPGTGQFGWLSWTSDVSNGSLVRSLVPPGDVSAYINPADPSDRLLSRGDPVAGRLGVQSSRGVRDALDALKGRTIVVPVWDESIGRGASLRYRISGFAQIDLTGYELAGQNRISAVFRRTVRCKGRS
jgi:hypothetical protein